jgi:uncharacterized protein
MSSPPTAGQPQSGTGSDPSMEDILASIRRILSEEEQEAAAPPAPTPKGSDDVLVLDSSMMVPEESATPPAPQAASPAPEPEPPTSRPPEPAPDPALVAPAAAQAAAGAMTELVRRLAAERHTQVFSGGPTIEDLVRAELRPLLKAWLDEYLAPLVERLVRAEIERVVGRAVP